MQARLDEGRTLADLRRAVDGTARSPRNTDPARRTIRTVFGDPARTDTLAELEPRGGASARQTTGRYAGDPQARKRALHPATGEQSREATFTPTAEQARKAIDAIGH